MTEIKADAAKPTGADVRTESRRSLRTGASPNPEVVFEKHSEAVRAWPERGKVILAHYTDDAVLGEFAVVRFVLDVLKCVASVPSVRTGDRKVRSAAPKVCWLQGLRAHAHDLDQAWFPLDGSLTLRLCRLTLNQPFAAIPQRVVHEAEPRVLLGDLAQAGSI
jgi:hypothetical protein